MRVPEVSLRQNKPHAYAGTASSSSVSLQGPSRIRHGGNTNHLSKLQEQWQVWENSSLRKRKRRPLTAGQYLDLLREKSIFSR